MMLEALARLFSGSSAIVMLTHNDDPRVIGHYERLKAESGLPTFRANNTGLDEAPATSSADIVLANADLEAALPRRYASMVAEKGRIARGYVDILEMALLAHPLLSSFDYVWMIESDVDFTGRWSSFFKQYRASKADLLTFRIRKPEDMPNWIQWRHLRAPPGAMMRCAFLPLSRFSRRFGEVYRSQIETGGWSGHFEGTVPTIALSEGLRLEDFGADAEFSIDRGRARLNHSTFGYRPVRATAYFHERPDAFEQQGMLYHPVKVGENLEQTSGKITFAGNG